MMTQETLLRKHTSVSFFNYDLKQVVETRDWQGPCSREEQCSDMQNGRQWAWARRNEFVKEWARAGFEYGKYRLILFPQ